MTLHIPPEYEDRLREAAAAAGYADLETYVIEKLLGGKQPGSAEKRVGGQWKGQVAIAEDFDELPDDLKDAFGITGDDESAD